MKVDFIRRGTPCVHFEGIKVMILIGTSLILIKMLRPILFLAAPAHVPVTANLCKSLHGAIGCRGLPAACSQISLLARSPVDFCLPGVARVQRQLQNEGRAHL